MNIKRNFSTILKNKKFKFGSISTAITIILIASIVTINIIVGELSNKFNLSIDVTKNKTFSLTEESVNFIKNINKDIEIIILNKESDFSNQNEYFMQANTVLKRYSYESNKIHLSYIDVIKNPTYLQNNFPNEELNTNSIIVRCNSKYKIITANDIFDISYGYYGNHIASSKAEQELTSALVYVTSENQIKISFLKGYVEQDYSSFSELLKKNNYNVVETSMLTEDIPEDTNAIVIFGPERDYDSKGTFKIENFLKNNDKTLIYIANPKLNESPNISNIVEKYGIKIKPGIIYETDTKKLTSSMNMFESICDYNDENFTKDLKSSDIPVLLPACKPLEATTTEDISLLLQFSKTSGIMPINADKTFDFKANICGPIPCSILSKKENKNLLVIGSFVGLTNEYLSATSINNSSYFINLINKILNKEDTGIVIEPKSFENEELGVNAMQANLIGISYTIILPLIVASIGIIVFLKRKNK